MNCIIGRELHPMKKANKKDESALHGRTGPFLRTAAGRQIMLSFFDVSTIMARPWAEAGYVCYCIDLQHPRGETRDDNNPNIIRVGADIHHWLPPRDKDVVFAAFFPPCTDLAVSGARWFRDKGIGKLVDAVALFKRSVELAELMKCPYLLENPVSTISKYWRPPDHTFHPNDYGDPYLKKTCLWTGGGFIMPKKRPVEPTEGMKLYWLPPSPERANLRSATPPGFARAVFNANKPGKNPQSNAGVQRAECAVIGPAEVAHIKPLHSLSERELADTANRLYLAPHIHMLFDKGLISIDDAGQILVSRRLTARDRRILALPAKLHRLPPARTRQFLKYHRENIFLSPKLC